MQPQCTPLEIQPGIETAPILLALADLSSRLRDPEMRVLLYIAARSVRAGRDSVAIPLRDFHLYSGAKKSAATIALRELEEKGFIERHRAVASHGGAAITIYRLSALLSAATAAESLECSAIPPSDSQQVGATNVRALDLGSNGRLTVQQWRTLKRRYGHACLCCGETTYRLTIDHVVPLTAGGINSIDNCQPLCGICNGMKGTRSIDFRPGWEEAYGAT